jgi:hypothetical protein
MITLISGEELKHGDICIIRDDGKVYPAKDSDAYIKTFTYHPNEIMFLNDDIPTLILINDPWEDDRPVRPEIDL